MKNLAQEIRHGNFWVFIIIILLVLLQLKLSFSANKEFCNKLKYEVTDKQYFSRTFK